MRGLPRSSVRPSGGPSILNVLVEKKGNALIRHCPPPLPSATVLLPRVNCYFSRQTFLSCIDPKEWFTVKPTLTLPTMLMVNDTDNHDDSDDHIDDDNEDDKNDDDDNDDNHEASTRFSRLSFVRNSFKNISNIFLQTQLPIFFLSPPAKIFDIEAKILTIFTIRSVGGQILLKKRKREKKRGVCLCVYQPPGPSSGPGYRNLPERKYVYGQGRHFWKIIGGGAKVLSVKYKGSRFKASSIVYQLNLKQRPLWVRYRTGSGSDRLHRLVAVGRCGKNEHSDKGLHWFASFLLRRSVEARAWTTRLSRFNIPMII